MCKGVGEEGDVERGGVLFGGGPLKESSASHIDVAVSIWL